jgi:hypothetical protein
LVLVVGLPLVVQILFLIRSLQQVVEEVQVIMALLELMELLAVLVVVHLDDIQEPALEEAVTHHL